VLRVWRRLGLDWLPRWQRAHRTAAQSDRDLIGTGREPALPARTWGYDRSPRANSVAAHQCAAARQSDLSTTSRLCAWLPHRAEYAAGPFALQARPHLGEPGLHLFMFNGQVVLAAYEARRGDPVHHFQRQFACHIAHAENTGWCAVQPPQRIHRADTQTLSFIARRWSITKLSRSTGNRPRGAAASVSRSR
jgi:hypothetical protein